MLSHQSPDEDGHGHEQKSGGMSFFEHLEELRGVLLRSFGALLLGCLLAAVGYSWIAGLLNWPLHEAITSAGEDPKRAELIGRGVFDAFSLLFRVIFIGGLVLSLPFILYFVAGFISPGLTLKERAILMPVCAVSALLFFVGGAFCFFLILPAAIQVSFYFFSEFGVTPQLDATRYYGLVVWTTIGVGLCFEFPLVLVVLQYLEIVTPRQLVDNWRLAVVVTVVLSALIVPGGDPLTLFLLAGPLMALYFGSIWAGRWLLRRK